MKRFIALPKPALAVLLCCTMVACDASQIARYITLIGQFAVNALTLVAAFQGKGISATDLATLNKFETLAQSVNADIQTAWSDYQKDHASGQPKMIAALQAAQDNLPAFLADAQIENPDLQMRIEAVTTALLMSAQSIAALFPTMSLPRHSEVTNAKSGRVYKLPRAVTLSPTDIKHYWNTVVCVDIAGCTI